MEELAVDFVVPVAPVDAPQACPGRLRGWEPRIAWIVGALGALLAVFVARGRMAVSPDAVSYIGAAEMFASGEGLGNWLENPLLTFPPLWPAAIALLTGLGLEAEVAAQVLVVVAIVVIPRLALVLLRRVTTVAVSRILGLLAVGVSPVLLPWGYQGLSEVPFTAVLLGVAALALSATPPRTDEPRSDNPAVIRTWLIWAAVALGSLLPLIRYAGVAIPVALAIWIAIDSKRRGRGIAAARALVAGLTPLALVLLRNQLKGGAAFGDRVPSSLNGTQLVQQGVAALGRTALWTLDAAPNSVSLLLGLTVIGFAAWVALRRGASEPRGGRSARLLLGILAATQWVVMLGARGRAEINDLDGRLLAPTAVMVVLLLIALVGDMSLDRERLTRTVALGAATAWCAIGLLATGRGAFIASTTMGYASDEFVSAMSMKELDEIPQECRVLTARDVIGSGRLPACGVLANEPWAWYRGDIRPLITPRRGGIDDVEMLRNAVESGSDIYIAWTTVNDPSVYLIQIEVLLESFEMQVMGADEGITLYRVTGTR